STPSTSTAPPSYCTARVPRRKRAPARRAAFASRPAVRSGSWPPGSGSRSTTVTFRPALASVAAQNRPRCPEPAITTLDMARPSHADGGARLAVGQLPGLTAEVEGGDERYAGQARRPLAPAPGRVRPLGDAGDGPGRDR